MSGGVLVCFFLVTLVFCRGDVLTCGCAVAGATNVVTMQAVTGLNTTIRTGGLLAYITVSIVGPIDLDRKRSTLQQVDNSVL
jgi:hypothetical protein